VNNAIKFTDKGFVKIRPWAESAEPDETRVTLFIEVQDSGIGIPSDQIEAIFGAFQQASGQSTRKFGGTGLGLAITRRLTEMMRGRIEVQSEFGRGSTFRLTFPNVAITALAETRERADVTDQEALDQFEPATILVADDVVKNLQVIGTMLRNAGYEVMPATSGRQALERVRAQLPDLVLLDLMMPEMDGLEVCRHLKEDTLTRQIPIIFLKASNEMEHLVKGFAAGAVDYVTKPFNPPELLARVRTHIELTQARERLRELNEEKNEFMGIVAHDLRNPLGAVQGYAEMITAEAQDLPRPIPEPVGEAVNRMTECAARIQETSRRMAEAMGGKVWCESEFGKGATFIVRVPTTGSFGQKVDPQGPMKGVVIGVPASSSGPNVTDSSRGGIKAICSSVNLERARKGKNSTNWVERGRDCRA
jgi:signal transduction histidine kinase